MRDPIVAFSSCDAGVTRTMTSTRLEQILALIDAANACDPQLESWQGETRPREWVYGQRMTAWLPQVCPDASEALQIAARGQHIRRWEVPRDAYPPGREGYLKWRTFLYGFHADKVAELMCEAGYEAEEQQRVKTLIQKRGIKTDQEVQVLEDVICLVFLAHYFGDFAATQSPDKLVGIVRKTWAKMSERGHELALQLPFPASLQPLLAEALGGA